LRQLGFLVDIKTGKNTYNRISSE